MPTFVILYGVQCTWQSKLTSWFTAMTLPTDSNFSQCSLFDSRCSLRDFPSQFSFFSIAFFKPQEIWLRFLIQPEIDWRWERKKVCEARGKIENIKKKTFLYGIDKEISRQTHGHSLRELPDGRVKSFGRLKKLTRNLKKSSTSKDFSDRLKEQSKVLITMINSLHHHLPTPSVCLRDDDFVCYYHLSAQLGARR